MQYAPMEEPGEQYTVVFVLIVTEPACELGVEGGGVLHLGHTPSLSLGVPQHFM